MTTINDGDLVYYDAFLCGLIPAKVLSCDNNPLKRDNDRVRVVLTADRKAHKRGEILHVRPNDVIPRAHVYRRNYKLLVCGQWRFAGLEDRYQPQWA